MKKNKFSIKRILGSSYKKNYDNLTKEEIVKMVQKKDSALCIFRPIGIFFILIIICIILYNILFLFRDINVDKTKYDDLRKMEELINANYYDINADYSLPHNHLEDFSLDKDKFTFKNLGSFNSEGGICLGFSLFEKFNYMNKLKDMDIKYNEKTIKFEKRLNIGDIFISSEDVGNLYKENKSSNVDFIAEAGQVENYSVELIYDLNVDHKLLDDFSDKTSEQIISDLLNTVNYFKVSGYKEIPMITIEPYKYMNKSEANKGVLNYLLNRLPFNDEEKIYKSFSPEIITNKIDNDEPVMIGLSPFSCSGHALLGYKYEYIDENTLKVFVSDSNYPLVKLDNNKNEEDKYNDEIKNNFFVLFKREDDNSIWQYIYNPRINDNYMYKGEFNSYIPQFQLLIQ